jgi:hypothetical protein
MPSATNLLKRYYFLFILITVAFSSCTPKDHNEKKRASFQSVIGIDFIEVHRTFENGLSFSRNGYQLSPIWKVKFLPDDKAMVYSPDRDKFLKFPVILDHDSLTNVANTWLKPIKLTKDSMLIQVLAVEGKKVYFDKSTVYMTFYSDNYIKNVLRKDIKELQKPTRRDTLFIKQRAAEVNANIDSAFAGREPIVLKSLSPRVVIEKVKVEAGIMNRFDSSDDYMYPEYNINIKQAYEDFGYSFYATVDTLGQVHFQQSMTYLSDDFKASTIKTINGIINGYLKNYIQITPGKTLGIVHTCPIILNVRGSKK